MHVATTLRRLTVPLNAILLALCGLLSIGEMAWHMFGSWLYVSMVFVALASAGSMLAALWVHPPRLLVLAALLANMLLFSVAGYTAFLEFRNPMGLSWTSIAPGVLLVAFSVNIVVLRTRLPSND